MSEKSPNVMIVIGNVSTCNTGLMTIVMTDHTSATRSIVTHSPACADRPETEVPGTRLTVRYTAATVPRYLSTVCMWNSVQQTVYSGQTDSKTTFSEGMCPCGISGNASAWTAFCCKQNT